MVPLDIKETMQVVKDSVALAEEVNKMFGSKKPGMKLIHTLNSRFGLTPRMRGREALLDALASLAGFGEGQMAVARFKRDAKREYGILDPDAFWTALVAGYMDRHDEDKETAVKTLTEAGNNIAAQVMEANPDKLTLEMKMARLAELEKRFADNEKK